MKELVAIQKIHMILQDFEQIKYTIQIQYTRSKSKQKQYLGMLKCLSSDKINKQIPVLGQKRFGNRYYCSLHY